MVAMRVNFKKLTKLQNWVESLHFDAIFAKFAIVYPNFMKPYLKGTDS